MSIKEWSKAIILFLFFVVVGSQSAKAGQYKTERDTSGKVMIIGDIGWNEWQEYAEWQTYQDTAYHPDKQVLAKLQPLISDKITFYLFAGSWCGDSRENLPKIYQLMDILGISYDQIVLTGVDRNKHDIAGKAQGMDIKLVPTLVILKDGIEIGRIEEHPNSTWENDLLEILNK